MPTLSSTPNSPPTIRAVRPGRGGRRRRWISTASSWTLMGEEAAMWRMWSSASPSARLCIPEANTDSSTSSRHPTARGSYAGPKVAGPSLWLQPGYRRRDPQKRRQQQRKIRPATRKQSGTSTEECEYPNRWGKFVFSLSKFHFTSTFIIPLFWFFLFFSLSLYSFWLDPPVLSRWSGKIESSSHIAITLQLVISILQKLIVLWGMIGMTGSLADGIFTPGFRNFLNETSQLEYLAGGKKNSFFS